ncbi:MAG: BrnA antitoxin family protein [bacterium]|nr:BrnA antitoxin family protein [bacterium]
MKKLKKIPQFKNEDDEFGFWSKHDSTEYLDYSKAKKTIFPNLKPSLKTISVRLPESLIEHLKVLVNQRDIPYQSLLKLFLIERVQKELRSSRL